jgi:hypothetical protein
VCEDTGIEFSGTAAILTLGLYMSNYGKTKISNETTPMAHGFWLIFNKKSKEIEILIKPVSDFLCGHTRFHHLRRIDWRKNKRN